MTIARIPVVACALLFAIAPRAHAQQWGGSPPPAPANIPMASPFVYAVPVIVIGQTPYYYATYDYNDYADFYARYYGRHASKHQQRQQHGYQQHGDGDAGTRTGSGGSWDGSRPSSGGSPAVRPADPLPDSGESVGYVAPPAAAAIAPVVAPRRTRDVYRERFGRP